MGRQATNKRNPFPRKHITKTQLQDFKSPASACFATRSQVAMLFLARNCVNNPVAARWAKILDSVPFHAILSRERDGQGMGARIIRQCA